VLLVLLCALGGVLLFSRADHRTEVLVAAGDLEAGEPITRGDLRIERITVDGDIRSLSPADAGALVGLLPVGRIPAGTLLARGMFADEVPLAADEIVFGAALDPGEAPLSGVQVGAPVEGGEGPTAGAGPTPAH
jgi:Flp pilus assembly protein CpaB